MERKGILIIDTAPSRPREKKLKSGEIGVFFYHQMSPYYVNQWLQGVIETLENDIVVDSSVT
jgi:hypothetical protein